MLIGACPGLTPLAAAPPPPNAGTILQQAQPTPPPAPSSNDSGLSLEQAPAGALPPSAPFLVAKIEITGNTRIPTQTLHALVASVEGQRITLPELNKLTARITAYYRAHGYPLARAIVPPQTLHAGVLRIEVVEARVGKVSVNNHSRVNTGLVESTLDTLKSGTVISQDPLDHSLLLLSDIPGMTVHATLKPGAEVGTSDLQVDTHATQPVIGSLTVDDGGDRYSGRARVGGNVSFVDPLHQGDLLDLGVLSSGSGMNYGRLSYDALLNGEGTRLGVGYSGLHYRLGGKLSDLDAHGTAQDANLDVKQPLIRGRDVNLYAQLQYDYLELNDDIGVSDIVKRRHLDNVAASLSGDVRDHLLAGAVNSWNASWTYGHLGFGNTEADVMDAEAARTQGSFSRLNLNLARLQSLSAKDALYFELSGQWAANRNLDPSQQLVLGGPSSVRAYDVSAISGDSGWTATTELRHTFTRGWFGPWQAIAFVDNAHLVIDKTAFAAGPNTARLNGGGVGLNWTGPDQWTAGVTVAAPFGPRPELVGDTNSVRAWAQLTKAF